MQPFPQRARSTLLAIVALWLNCYSSFTLFTPPLLDDADSVHAEVAREMLLRHDYVTLYANGVRYLEKAPLLYWSMAACMRVVQLFGGQSARALAAAARVPMALTVLALALLCEAFARRVFRSASAGLYAALAVLSSFGIFIFSHITLPDTAVCLWLMVALYVFWQTEQTTDKRRIRSLCQLFGLACALNVLTKGLIGVVFPVGIVLGYLLFTRGVRGARARLQQLHPADVLLVLLLVAAPWHIAAGLANPTQGHPASFHFVNATARSSSWLHGHWIVPTPIDGNVRGWFWFYFMNEHVLRYLNLRVPRDYDTVPLWLFWGLCLVWLMPWSAFAFKALSRVRTPFVVLARLLTARNQQQRSSFRFQLHYLPLGVRSEVLLALAVCFVLLFFSLSTRQEYYVLPALPAASILIAGWLSRDTRSGRDPATERAQQMRRANLRITTVLVLLGMAFALASLWLILHTRRPAPSTDLAQLLAQNPGEYALSMGHFLDLNAQALGLFRLPLALASVALLGGPLASLLLRRRGRPHAATLAIAGGAFLFLLAADLGLLTFAPTLTSAQLARAIAPQVHAQDMLAIHGEYEAGSSLAFYLLRSDVHIFEGRSSNLWYGSFFPDAPHIFETRESLAEKWLGPQRIFLWQDTEDKERKPFTPAAPVYVIAQSEGKQVLSNQPNR